MGTEMEIKNIWEIHEQFYCPVAGYCLTPEEQTMLVRKNGYTKVLTEQGIDIHHFFISALRNETSFSRQVNLLLMKKYGRTVEKYGCRDSREWTADAEKYLNAATLPEFVWISAACFDLDEAGRKIILGLIHNYGHNMLFECSQLLKKNNFYEKKLVVMECKYKELKAELKKMHRESAALKSEIKNLNTSSGKTQAESQSAPSINTGADISGQFIEKLHKTIYDQNQHIFRISNENKNLQKKLDSNTLYLNSIKTDFADFLEQMNAGNEKCSSCEKVSLCDRNILIVGGMEKFKSFYEELVSKLGGNFSYHNGNSHGCNYKLSELICRSDVIICPVDVNSHAACLHVKKECKKRGKEYFMLRKSSISSVYNALVSVTAGDTLQLKV